MKKSRFTETQIVSILKETDAGIKVGDVCRKYGISSATYYNWKSKYSGMQASDIKKLKELQDKNAHLKKMYAELRLENRAFKELFEKKGLVTAEKRTAVSGFVGCGVSISRACKVLSLGRASYYRKPKDWRVADAAFIEAINQQLKKSPRAGFWKCYNRIRRNGFIVNHKRIYRVYCHIGLNIRRRAKRTLPKRLAQPLDVIAAANHQWALDFVHNSLYCGKRFRTLNVIDEGTRECLAIEVDSSLPAARLVRTLERLEEQRGLPQQIRVDNGPELISAEFNNWCKEKKINIAYIEAGKPQKNGFVERFNGSFRREFLDAYLFESLNQVWELAWQWMLDYNDERP